MAQSKFIAVRCRLSRGIHSTERAYAITLANGEIFSGPAPTHFCWNDQGKLIGPNEALDEVDGWVAAYPLKQQLPGDQVAVEVPWGEALAVRQSQVREAWTDIRPPAPTPWDIPA